MNYLHYLIWPSMDFKSFQSSGSQAMLIYWFFKHSSFIYTEKRRKWEKKVHTSNHHQFPGDNNEMCSTVTKILLHSSACGIEMMSSVVENCPWVKASFGEFGVHAVQVVCRRRVPKETFHQQWFATDKMTSSLLCARSSATGFQPGFHSWNTFMFSCSCCFWPHCCTYEYAMLPVKRFIDQRYTWRKQD